MSSTALVEASDDVAIACIPKTTRKDANGNPILNSGKKYVMHFGKSRYYVPQRAIVSYAKRPHNLKDGYEVGNLIATKAPDRWQSFCDPDTLMLIQGDDGSTCVYTTLAVSDTDEQRFVRIISPTVAERCFPRWLEELGISVDKETGEWDRSKERGLPENEKDRARVIARRNVLRWRKDNPLLDANDGQVDVDLGDPNAVIPGCPSRAQLSPELSRWPLVPESDPIVTCKIAPETRKRPKGSSRERNNTDDVDPRLNKYVKKNEYVHVGPVGSYTVTERDGFVHITQYYTNEENDANDEGDAQDS